MMRQICARYFSTATKNIRNVGIIAHIDAGKTTTTERILFDAGKISAMGEVDRGTTVTDFMEEERRRGITICSATAAVKWQEHAVHLLDTPGHADFTLEVERCLCVVDGAVTILDSTRGVEAQTQTVWNQAAQHNIASLIYLNKFDRKTANLKRCIASIRNKLPHAQPALVTLPNYRHQDNSDSQFNGILDVVDLTVQEWETDHKSPCPSGRSQALSDSDPRFPDVLEARLNLIEILADVEDGHLRHEFLQLQDPGLLIPPRLIHDALRTATVSAHVCPVLVGSSKLNIGVASLLDRVVAYLPSPTDRATPAGLPRLPEDSLCALVFKIVHDKWRGPLTYLRLYSGHLRPQGHVLNLNRTANEKVEKILQMTGDIFSELEVAGPGHIVVVTGLHHSLTGDLIVDNDYQQDTDREDASPIVVPDPVMYASIEANSLSAIKSLETVLAQIVREDPSLKFYRDEESRQLVLGGMGSLHLEVALSRVQREPQLVATRLSRVRIGYRETVCLPVASQPVVMQYEARHGSSPSSCCVVDLQLQPVPERPHERGHLRFRGSRDWGSWASLQPRTLRDIRAAGEAALEHAGPLLRSPLVGVDLVLHRLTIGNSGSDISTVHHTAHALEGRRDVSKTMLPLVRSAVVGALRLLLADYTDVLLLEPIVRIELTFPHSDVPVSEYMSRVLSDLHRRRAQIQSVDSVMQSPALVALVPLAEAVDLSEAVRALTSGHGSLHLRLAHYDRMDPEAQYKVLRRRGARV